MKIETPRAGENKKDPPSLKKKDAPRGKNKWTFFIFPSSKLLPANKSIPPEKRFSPHRGKKSPPPNGQPKNSPNHEEKWEK